MRFDDDGDGDSKATYDDSSAWATTQPGGGALSVNVKYVDLGMGEDDSHETLLTQELQSPPEAAKLKPPRSAVSSKSSVTFSKKLSKLGQAKGPKDQTGKL